ncbi:hypothetical protein NM208_g15657 [Fusarium decemcellulare]|uniref:Uncharacterized protein n=1 Tax=Fusarium decemcellulare TaxID=57161 RepID=A0ACC1RCI0_9HYPO|nr:hypothetical protein NM208_g15657 [Fusarium decemcellulare]
MMLPLWDETVQVSQKSQVLEDAAILDADSFDSLFTSPGGCADPVTSVLVFQPAEASMAHRLVSSDLMATFAQSWSAIEKAEIGLDKGLSAGISSLPTSPPASCPRLFALVPSTTSDALFSVAT